MRRRRWHTHIHTRAGIGCIVVLGCFTPSAHDRRWRIARQLARWAWGGWPGESKPAPAGARQRDDELRQVREAG